MSFAALELAIEEAGLQPISSQASAKFEAYLALLLEWNARLNLTAIREESAILRRHFIECIQCVQALPALPEGSNLLDFGSGAGLPGVPIAICRPEIRVTLAESQRKKTAFLRETVRSLELSAEVFDGRVENMPQERRFAVVTLRAVDKMAEACRIALARTEPHGWIAIFTTTATEAEMKSALPDLVWQHDVPMPGLVAGRILLGQRLN